MNQALTATLGEVAAAMRPARDPWWIIGSAAVALHGGSPIEVADVDVLCSVDDARALLERLGLVAIAGAHDPLFQSSVFARWDGPPLAVELMAGFHVRQHGAWTEVYPATRQSVQFEGGSVAVPSRAELRALLLAFGREKDLVRARLLA